MLAKLPLMDKVLVIRHLWAWAPFISGQNDVQVYMYIRAHSVRLAAFSLSP